MAASGQRGIPHAVTGAVKNRSIFNSKGPAKRRAWKLR
jgi:hypothetical protein